MRLEHSAFIYGRLLLMSTMKNLQSKLKALVSFLLMLVMINIVSAVETITYYHNDALGSPIAATDEAGNLKWREEYLPYGERLLKQDGKSNDTWFTGKQEDKATGLSYFGARWYDPVLGRFTGIDPVGFQEGNIHSFNRYAYANNNPYRFVDPDGRETNPVSGRNFIKDSQLRTNSSNPRVGKQGYTRTSNNWNKGFHNGVDISASKGTPLVAPISGKVTTQNNPKGGNVIFITGVNDNGDIVKVGMAHLDSISVKNGSTINEGSTVGTSGNTGNALGMSKSEEHVHLSVRVNGNIVNPQKHFFNNPKK